MLNKIKNFVLNSITNISDSHEFKPLLSEIESSPVSPLGRFTFWTVVALITVTIFWLFIGKVDIVVKSHGMVIPDGEAKIIQPYETGVIKDILVKEGDFVKKGQILIDVDSSTTDANLKSVEDTLVQANMEASQLKSVSNGGGFLKNPDAKKQEEWQTQKDIYNQKISSLNQQIGVKQLEITKVGDEIRSTQSEKRAKAAILQSSENRKRKLDNVIDVIAYNDYQKAVDDVKENRAEVEKLSAQINQLESQKRQIRNEIAQIKADFKKDNLEQFADLQKNINQLEANKEQILFSNQKQKITAPCDGYVDKLFNHTIGGVITPAQQLIALTPAEKPLVIKAQVQNRDIGFIKVGMPVSIKIDTFDFQKYGILEGKVKSISQNSLPDEKQGQIYQVFITPITKTFIIEGKEKDIATGMTLNAEINIGKRRIIDFFLYPLIKYLDEGISVR